MIFITGATGLVGSHLLFDLVLKGERVIALKRKNSDLGRLKNVFASNPDLSNQIEFVEGDILDMDSLQKVFRQIKKVYHCAGVVSFDPDDVQSMREINIKGTANIVKLCIQNKIEKLCYVSSVSAINRINEDEIIDENTEWKTSNENTNYALSKYTAENIVWKGIEQGLHAVIINPTIIIGAGDWETGSTAMFHQVWKGLKFYTKGTAGFVDVKNVSEAMTRLMESEIHSERFIVNGENLAYRHVFNLIAEYLRKPRPLFYANSLLLNLAWRLAVVKKSLLNVKPFITKETIVSGRKKLQFSNEKIIKAINIQFIPIEKSIKRTCADFLRYQQQNKRAKEENSFNLTSDKTSGKLTGSVEPIHIYGIQQIGVGVDNAQKAFEWYATKLGSDILVFDDDNIATYMACYMGGKPHKRRAMLAMNLQGGSGYEFWQYLDRNPLRPESELKLGDLGINIAKIKSRDIFKSYKRLKDKEVQIISNIEAEPCASKCFYIKDPYNNILQIQEHNSWRCNNKKDIGGIFGCMLGVSDIDNSMKLYSGILGYTKVIYDTSGYFNDIAALPNGHGKFRRVLLAHENNRTGGFSKLFGESRIELIQSLDSMPKLIYQNRYWGDIGFIHLCFDIHNITALVKECELKGFPFKVLCTDSFKMDQANAHWGYIEDPDRILIEFVETHKVSLIKKINWNINMQKRDPGKPLPDWLIRVMSIHRVKFAKNSLQKN